VQASNGLPSKAIIASGQVSGKAGQAPRRLAGYRLVATDEAWTAGAGQQVTGPIDALLLLLTGRPAALAHLSGPGAATLRAGAFGVTP
jgi:hypothetical protein